MLQGPYRQVPLQGRSRAVSRPEMRYNARQSRHMGCFDAINSLCIRPQEGDETVDHLIALRDIESDLRCMWYVPTNCFKGRWGCT